MSPKEARDLWATELESGKWRQTDGQLARETDEGTAYCCLGVACELAVREGVIGGYCGDDGDLDEPVQAWLGLSQPDGSYDAGFNAAPMSLARLNDKGALFPEIAAIIRDEPEGLVVS